MKEEYKCEDCGENLTPEEFQIWESAFPNGFGCSCNDARTIVRLRNEIKKLKRKLKETSHD
jgi:transcription initiation factor IIE alpha subunit